VKRWFSHYNFYRYRNKNVLYNKTDLGVEDYLNSTEGLQNARMYTRHFFSYSIGDEILKEHVTEAAKNILQFDVYGILE